MEEKTDLIAKVDMVIAHISDCILELDYSNAGPVSAMTIALADLVRARTSAIATNGRQQTGKNPDREEVVIECSSHER